MGEIIRFFENYLKKPKLEKRTQIPFLPLSKKPSNYDLSLVLLELSFLLESGLNFIKALEVVISQTNNPKIKQALIEIKEAIEGGERIDKAFSKVGFFPEFFIEMLKLSQRGENLEKVLRIAGEYLQKTEETKSKVLTAIAYPLFVIFASFFALMVVIKLVIPKIASVLQSLGKELPLITKLLILFSQVISYLVYLLPLLLVFYIFKDKIIKREVLDKYLLRIPIFGHISLSYNLSRFAETLYMGLSSGIPMPKAIKLSLGSLSNSYIRSSLDGIDLELSKGKSLSLALREKGILPESFINLLAMGEKSGELEKSLKLLSSMYERQAEKTISFWLRFVEPIAMLFVALLVALVVLSVVLPLSEISTIRVR